MIYTLQRFDMIQYFHVVYAFVVNAALVASQWKHSVLTFTLQPINSENEAGQAAKSVIQVFSVTRQGIEHSLSALVTW